MTTSPSRQVSIRPPALIRTYVVAFLVFWVGAVVWTTMVHRHGPSIFLGIVFLAFGATLGWRLLRLGVQSEADGTLTVRNNLGRRRLTRSQVEDFRIGSNGGGRLGQRGVQVLLHDGTVYGLDVCRAPFGLGRQRLNTQLADLNAWLRDG